MIVEIATLLTDDDLELIAEEFDLIVHATPEQLAEMDDFVTNMHTRVACSTRSPIDDRLEEAGAQTLAFLQAHPEARTVPLCGNSIGTDRRFLAAHLPEVEEFLHYRSIDVSTLKELVADGTRRPKTAPKAGGHRAWMASARASRSCATTAGVFVSCDASSQPAERELPTYTKQEQSRRPRRSRVADGGLRMQLPIVARSRSRQLLRPRRRGRGRPRRSRTSGRVMERSWPG